MPESAAATRETLIDALEQIAQLLELKDENPFKIRAYRTGAATVRAFPGDIAALARDNQLAGIKGIGGAVANAVAAAIGGTAARGVTALPIRPDDLAPLLPMPAAPDEPSAARPPVRPRPVIRRRPAAAIGALLVLAATGWLARRGRKER